MKTIQAALLGITLGHMLTVSQLSAQDNLTLWFDQPNTSRSVPVWGQGEVAPDEGCVFENKDWEWEHTSLPLGNGSIGANILGSIATERFTFNEKSLWRGGPNTSAGTADYWNVNKPSANVLKDIRQAFAQEDTERATQLTQENFNSEVPYDPEPGKPFRFGSFTSCGEFTISTGISEEQIQRYARALSLDSALATVSF